MNLIEKQSFGTLTSFTKTKTIDALTKSKTNTNKCGVKQKSFICKYSSEVHRQLPINFNSIHFEKPYVCFHENCSKSYTRLSYLKKHEETHNENFRCPIEGCQSILKTKSTLTKHLDVVHCRKQTKQYKCSHCEKQFNKQSYLRIHEYHHTNIKPFLCPKESCDKRFLTPSKLKRHLKCHEGYRCDKPTCNKVYPNWSSYVNHVKVMHPIDYICHECNKKFFSSYNLSMHKKIHQEEREIFPCTRPNCPKYYFAKRFLTHHIRFYHNKRPFVCDVAACLKEFKSKDALEEHKFYHDPNHPLFNKICKKKKKGKRSNPKPSFAAKLAGCVPPKNENKISSNDNNSFDVKASYLSSDASKSIENQSLSNELKEELYQNSLPSSCNLQQKNNIIIASNIIIIL